MNQPNVFQKLVTLVKSGFVKGGEAIADAGAIPIMEQEIKDAQSNIDKAKQDLTKVMRSSMQCGRKIEDLRAEITKHEGYAVKAMAQNKNELALEVAGKISEFECELNVQQSAKEKYDTHIDRLKKQVKDTQRAIENMSRELTMVKTTESVQKASASIADNYAHGTSKVLGAKQSLERIKQRQQNHEDELLAGEKLREEFEGTSLEDQLREEGIIENTGNANSILERLKASQSNKVE